MLGKCSNTELKSKAFIILQGGIKYAAKEGVWNPVIPAK